MSWEVSTMKSKTSFFNRTIFFNLYKRFWPIFAGYFAILLILLPIPLQSMLRYAVESIQISGDYGGNLAIEAAETVMSLSLYGGMALSAVFAIIIAMAAYSYLYNAKNVSMMCSLPIKREGVFLTVTAAGLLAMLVSNVVVFLITAAVEASYGVLGFGYLMQGLAVVCLMNIFFFGFAVLCASFTGHVLVLPAVYVVLNFTVAVVEVLVNGVLGTLLYGYVESFDFRLSALSPVVGILSQAGVRTNTTLLENGMLEPIGVGLEGWTLLIVYGIVGVAFIACATLLIKRRRMETAGDVVAVKQLKPVFKYCLCLGCSLVIGTCIYSIMLGNWLFGIGSGRVAGIENMSYMLLFMLIGAFVGYFAAEMLMKKTLRVFKRQNWAGFTISALVIVALVVGTELDAFGFEKRVPELNEIEKVSIYCQGEVVLTEEDNIEMVRRLHSSIIATKAENERIGKSGEYIDEYYVTINYTLNSGRKISRSYALCVADEEGYENIYPLMDILNTREAVTQRMLLDVPFAEDMLSYAYISLFDADSGENKDFELTSEQMKELYKTCIVPDAKENRLGKISLFDDDNYDKHFLMAGINFELRERVVDDLGNLIRYNYNYISATLTVDSERTRAWIEENLGVRLVSIAEAEKIQEQNMGPEEKEEFVYEALQPEAVTG